MAWSGWPRSQPAGQAPPPAAPRLPSSTASTALCPLDAASAQTPRSAVRSGRMIASIARRSPASVRKLPSKPGGALVALPVVRRRLLQRLDEPRHHADQLLIPSVQGERRPRFREHPRTWSVALLSSVGGAGGRHDTGGFPADCGNRRASRGRCRSASRIGGGRREHRGRDRRGERRLRSAPGEILRTAVTDDVPHRLRPPGRRRRSP